MKTGCRRNAPNDLHGLVLIDLRRGGVGRMASSDALRLPPRIRGSFKELRSDVCENEKGAISMKTTHVGKSLPVTCKNLHLLTYDLFFAF